MSISKKFECSAVINGIEIEFTNYCGLDCFGCIRKMSENFGFLDFETLAKIISFIKNKNYKEIVLSGLGDVFLHEKLYDFLDYIFLNLPNIKIYIMTKGQSVKESDIDKFLEYKEKGFNLSITYSIFSLDKIIYFKSTGGGNINYLLKIIKYSHKKNINFNFEFLLNKENIKQIEKYKTFCSLFRKNFTYSIPHNWGGNLSDNDYNKIYNYDSLKDIIEKRKLNDKCEAFVGDYMFFDYSGDIYKCGLQRFNKNLFLGNIKNNSNLVDFSKLDYDKCKKCSYFNYKTKIG